ncbi:hypothetical protein [Robinsoniella sp. KNHs210]|nr:hypothetical protein [Robinsoniella sp. KNHs210]
MKRIPSSSNTVRLPVLLSNTVLLYASPSMQYGGNAFSNTI